MKDALGDRMKLYEGTESDRNFMPLLPIMARMDGRCFSGFTKGMERPFDQRMSECMIETTKGLVDHTHACMGYTQSDEITLAWHSTSFENQVWFNGRITKMASVLASLTTVIFYQLVLERMPEYARKMPTWDARVWNVPNQTEAANTFLWREWDATKNSLSMAAQAYYSHKQLFGKNGKDKHDMLHAKGVNWNNYPSFFKRGTYVQRRIEPTAFSAEELKRLPPKHKAHQDPNLVVERSVIKVLDLPPLKTVANRESMIFDGARPRTGVELNQLVSKEDARGT